LAVREELGQNGEYSLDELYEMLVIGLNWSGKNILN